MFDYERTCTEKKPIQCFHYLTKQYFAPLHDHPFNSVFIEMIDASI